MCRELALRFAGTNIVYSTLEFQIHSGGQHGTSGGGALPAAAAPKLQSPRSAACSPQPCGTWAGPGRVLGGCWRPLTGRPQMLVCCADCIAPTRLGQLVESFVPEGLVSRCFERSGRGPGRGMLTGGWGGWRGATSGTSQRPAPWGPLLRQGFDSCTFSFFLERLRATAVLA